MRYFILLIVSVSLCNCASKDKPLPIFGERDLVGLDEYDISRAWVDSRLLTIGGGTSEIMKEIVSKMSGY